MRIHPAATPLEKVRVGDAIASLPEFFASVHNMDSDIVRIPPSQQDDLVKVLPGLEFVRFLTEQDGRMIHVWKRTK